MRTLLFCLLLFIAACGAEPVTTDTSSGNSGGKPNGSNNPNTGDKPIADELVEFSLVQGARISDYLSLFMMAQNLYFNKTKLDCMETNNNQIIFKDCQFNNVYSGNLTLNSENGFFAINGALLEKNNTLDSTTYLQINSVSQLESSGTSSSEFEVVSIGSESTSLSFRFAISMDLKSNVISWQAKPQIQINPSLSSQYLIDFSSNTPEVKVDFLAKSILGKMQFTIIEKSLTTIKKQAKINLEFDKLKICHPNPKKCYIRP